MAGDFAILVRNGGGLGPILIEDHNDLSEAVQQAKEISVSRKVTCLVYCYKENVHKYRFDPHLGKSVKPRRFVSTAALQATPV